MAKEADFQSTVAYNLGYNGGNMLRTKAQQYYGASNSARQDGPSRIHIVIDDRRKNYDSRQIDDNIEQSGISSHRKRSEHFDRSRFNVVLDERQSANTGGVQDNRIGMSTPRGSIQNEKQFSDKGIENCSRKERPYQRDDCRQSFNDESSGIERSKSSLSTRNDSGRVQHMRDNSGLIIQRSSLQNNPQNITAASVSGRNLHKDSELITNSTQAASRSGSLERRKVQIRQSDLSVVNPARAYVGRRSPEPRRVEKTELKGSQSSDSTGKQIVDVQYSSSSNASAQAVKEPFLNPNTDARLARNHRYSKSFSSTDRKVLPSAETQKSHLESGSGITDSVLRRSFQEGEKKGGGKMERNLPDRIDMIRKQSTEIFHQRQGSDPTSQSTGTRKLSSVSQDLMRSKEELINRSKEYGRQLDAIKQRKEEERIARNENRSEPLQKATERKWSQQSSEYSENGESTSLDLKQPHDRTVSEDQGRQSPRHAKRKSSYIDSWIKSQQNRISSLASAIKEEDSDDSSQQTKSSSEQRSKFAPADSLGFLSWGRRDDYLQPTNDRLITGVSHSRSHSGDGAMGIVKSKELQETPSSRFPDETRRDPGNAKVTSPREKGPGYSPDDIRARSYSLQKETYSRSRQLDRSPRSPLPPNSSVELVNFEGRPRPTIVSSPRSQSERTSPQLQRSFESGKSFSVGNSPRLHRETTFDSKVKTDVVSTSPSPRNNSLSRKSSSSGSNSNSIHRTSSCTTPTERSPLASGDFTITAPVYRQDQQQSSTPNKSGTDDQFDWPAPPEFDVFVHVDDPQNQSWPASSSSPFMKQQSLAEGSRNFPVAVVKPLQHEKTQSWDGTSSYRDAPQSKGSDIDQLQKLQPIFHEAARSEAFTYNVSVKGDASDHSRQIPRELSSSLSLPREYPSNLSLSPDTSSYTSLSREHSSSASLPRDVSSNSSMEIINERCVDVGQSNSAEELNASNKGISNLITQEFQWYRPPGQSSHDTRSYEHDFPRDSTRDSTRERLGRFKRGSKLLSSKYQSFSKSLENLSKVGKDLIKGKKKDEKAEKSKKYRPERKSEVLGDLKLNEEFAMKMERKSRSSLEMANTSDCSDVSMKQDRSEMRQNNGSDRKMASPEGKQTVSKKKETLIDFPFVPAEAEVGKSTNGVHSAEEGVSPQSDSVPKSHVSRGDGSVRRREVKSAYFDDNGKRQVSARPKSEFYGNEFEDFDDLNDEPEKEIVRKISGLRSSQVKKKSPARQDGPRETRSRSWSDAPARMPQPVSVGDSSDERLDQTQNVNTERGRSPEIVADEANIEETRDNPSYQAPSVENEVKPKSDPDPMKRISTSLSRVMTDLRELREQDLTLATQLITLGKSIKHFKTQKKEMDDLYVIMNDGETTEDSDFSDDEEEHGSRWSGPSRSSFGSRITADF